MNLLPNGFLDMLMAAPPPPHVPPVHRPKASQPQVADVDNEPPQQAADVDIPPPQQATDVDNPPPQQATDVDHPPPQKVTGPEHPAAADVIAANADKSGIVIFWRIILLIFVPGLVFGANDRFICIDYILSTAV